MDSVTKISHWTYLLQIVCNFKCDFQPWRYINKGRLSYVITTKSVSETVHTGKPGMLQSRPFFRSQRFGHDWVTELCVTNIWFLLMLHIHHRSDILSHIASPLVAQMVKNLPTMWETWVQSLDWEDPLKKGTATCSGILAWGIPWTEEPGGLQSTGSQRVRHDWATFPFHLSVFSTEADGSPTVVTVTSGTRGLLVHCRGKGELESHAH